MAIQHNKTKQRILEEACVLFAKHGFKSVSTRMIASAAGVRHGTVHYHFKSKKELYIEVFRMVFDFEHILTYDVLLAQEPFVLQTPSGKAYAIQRIVTDFFHRHLHVAGRWKRRLVLRELFEHSPVFHRILNEVLKVESDKMMEFYFLLNPTGTIVDAYLWSHLPDVQILNHMMGESILETDHDAAFVEELHQKMVKITARSMISILDLPIPDMLQ